MNTTIISNKKINDSFFLLTAKFKKYKKPAPGQFVMIKVTENREPLLRRPMSICDANDKRKTLDILYQIVGTGTKILSQKKKGDYLDISKPFGVGFNFNPKIKNAIFVGGGVGIAPFLLLAKTIKTEKMKIKISAFIGGRSKNDILLKDAFEKLGCDVIISTENGSLGIKGLITAPLSKFLKKNKNNSTLFSCGPYGMMKATAKLSEKNNIECQVSLDERMACGIGVCMGCVIKFKDNDSFIYKCACKNGPVFNANDVFWE